MPSSTLAIIFGPPFVGKTKYIQDTMRKKYNHVKFDLCDENTWQRVFDQQVPGLLQMGINVVVDQYTYNQETRNHMITTVRTKVPSSQIKCWHLEPKYGSGQLWWIAEHCLAESIDKPVDESQRCTSLMRYKTLEAWGVNGEPPSEDEGFHDIIKIIMEPRIRAHFEFEVPALFIEWQCMFEQKDDDTKAHENLSMAIRVWLERNTMGRVIVLKPEPNTNTIEENALQPILESIIKQNYGVLFYVIHFGDASFFHNETPIAPNCNIIAFQQSLHHLNLYHKKSVYWWTSNKHRLLAKAIGMKSLQVKPDTTVDILMNDNYIGLENNAIPSILRSMKVAAAPMEQTDLLEPWPVAAIPLYDDSLLSTADVVLKKPFSANRQLYLVTTSAVYYHLYNSIYHSKAMAVCGEHPLHDMRKVITEILPRPPSTLEGMRQRNAVEQQLSLLRTSNSANKMQAIPIMRRIPIASPIPSLFRAMLNARRMKGQGDEPEVNSALHRNIFGKYSAARTNAFPIPLKRKLQKDVNHGVASSSKSVSCVTTNNERRNVAAAPVQSKSTNSQISARGTSDIGTKRMKFTYCSVTRPEITALKSRQPKPTAGKTLLVSLLTGSILAPDQCMRARPSSTTIKVEVLDSKEREDKPTETNSDKPTENSDEPPCKVRKLDDANNSRQNKRDDKDPKHGQNNL